jgi:hypothetical protein
MTERMTGLHPRPAPNTAIGLILDLPITRRMLGVGRVGSRRIWPAHVASPVGPDGSRQIQKDRLDDHRDDQGASDRESDGWARRRHLRVIASSGGRPDLLGFGMARAARLCRGTKSDGYESQKTSKVPLVTAWTYDAAPARTRRCSSVHAAFERPGWTRIVRNVGRSCETSCRMR